MHLLNVSFTLQPFYIEDYLHASIDWYGYLIGSFTGASIVGAMSAGYLKIAPVRRGKLL
jgi:hypothetical protein